MTVLLSVYNLIWIFIGFCVLSGVVYRLLYIKLKASWIKDIELQTKINDDLYEKKIEKNVNIKFEMVNKEISLLQGSIGELKGLITALQETSLAIQLGVSDMRPRLNALEKRVERIEDRNK